MVGQWAEIVLQDWEKKGFNLMEDLLYMPGLISITALLGSYPHFYI